MVAGKPGYLAQIQVLRGFAALCVVLTHAFLGAGWIDNLSTLTTHPFIGEFGVDVFFVISGFIMVVISSRDFGQPGAIFPFLKKRIIRVVPLYWMLSLLLIAIIFLAPQFITSPKIDVFYWLKSLLFIPAEHPVEGGVRPVLVVGWTLQYEMFFYLLFAFSMLFSLRTGMLVLFGLLGSAVAIGQITMPENTILHFFSEPILLEFAGGAGLGLAYLKGYRLPRSSGWLLPLVAAILLALGWMISQEVKMDRVWFFGIPAALLVGGFVLPRGMEKVKVSRVGLGIGDSSYALYLSHVFVVAALGFLFNQVFTADWQQVIWVSTFFVFVAVALSLVTGWLLHVWIDKPVGVYLNIRSKPKSAGPPAWQNFGTHVLRR